MNPNELPPLSLFHHRIPLQIRFSDVDVLGHVNNTVYMAFYDTGKAAYMTAVLGRKISWKEVDTVIANINCAFVAPIFFGENIEVLTACTGIHDKSFHLLQMIVEKDSGQVKSVCETVMVCFDVKTQTSCHVSDEWKEKLQAFESHNLIIVK
ncbi:MAG: acyl-CoA thioesterase [Muribaculaceae bacterium]|nr:acyl-CoA thioesterase [Muribaculaceae bacterium]